MNGSIDEVSGERGVICLPFAHNCVFWENCCVCVCVCVCVCHFVNLFPNIFVFEGKLR